MIINKQVTIAKINTMADGTIRLSIDILGGTPEDLSSAYALREIETTMILASTEAVNQQVEHVDNVDSGPA